MKLFRYLVVAVIVVALFVTVPIYKVDGTSMNYGLVEGDIVITTRWFRSIERGDLIVMRHPLDPKDRLYLKRARRSAAIVSLKKRVLFICKSTAIARLREPMLHVTIWTQWQHPMDIFSKILMRSTTASSIRHAYSYRTNSITYPCRRSPKNTIS